VSGSPARPRQGQRANVRSLFVRLLRLLLAGGCSVGGLLRTFAYGVLRVIHHCSAIRSLLRRGRFFALVLFRGERSGRLLLHDVCQGA
jgi:hypothetical protein